MAGSEANGDATAPSIKVKALNYSFPDGSNGLYNVNLELPPGSRTLLIGGMYPTRPYLARG